MSRERKPTDREGWAPEVGVPRTRAELDLRRDPILLAAISQVAPGTDLRQGIDDIIRSREGALIVIGDPDELSFLYSGGMRLDLPFTPQLCYELAKMDGAIIVKGDLTRLAYANVQLMPDPTIASNETGTRHRTAERVAKQTDALVISISQQRETVTVFLGHRRYQLEQIAAVLAKTNQALGTLETYRQRLDQVLTRLTALEFQNAVMLDDVLVVLQRAELTTRMAEEIERACVELGSEGRMIRMQLEELVGEVPREKAAVVYDYHAKGGVDATREGLQALSELAYKDLLEFELLAVLGYAATTNPLDHSVQPRGYRVLSRVPRLPDSVIRHVVEEMGNLEAIVRASQRDLESVDGVGAVRARDIREGLRRLQEHNLVDRYLQL
jgi:diadenylate cyclase